jgi:hypothetical protein
LIGRQIGDLGVGKPPEITPGERFQESTSLSGNVGGDRGEQPA